MTPSKPISNSVGENSTAADPNLDHNDPLFVAAVARSVRVLEAFSGRRDALGVTELGQLTGLGKSAAQRFVHTWEQLGYLVQESGSRRYRLAHKVLELGYSYLRSDVLISAATPHLVALRDRCGLAVNLSVLAGQEMLYVLRLPSRQNTLSEMLPGRRMPAWANSSGRMLLTQFDDDGVRDILCRIPPRAMTNKTTLDIDELVAQIGQARSLGYSIAEEQVHLNQIGAAVLLHDDAQRPIAAISLATTLSDYPRKRVISDLVPQLLKTASAIS